MSSPQDHTEAESNPEQLGVVTAAHGTAPTDLPGPPNFEIDAETASQLAPPSVAENQPPSPIPEHIAEPITPDFYDECHCSDCIADYEDEEDNEDNEGAELMAVDDDILYDAPESVTIEFPHIIDTIRDYALSESPLTMRRVNRAARHRVDRYLGRHVRLDLRAPGLIRNGLQEPYLWLFSSAAYRIPFLKRSLGGPGQSTLLRSRTSVRDIARILDVHACTEFVKRPVDISDWPKLQTIRLVQGRGSVAFHTVHTLPQIERIIFSDGPYNRDCAEACPTFEQMFIGRSHHRTRRVVCNFRTPGNSNGRDIVPLPRLAELVVILHGWDVIPGFDPRARHRRNHPLNEVRGIALMAALEGTRVTVVNPELADLRTGRRRCNMGDVTETLRRMWRRDLLDEPTADGQLIDEAQILGRIEFKTLQQCQQTVGEDEFTIETMTDAAAQVPQYC